MKTAILIHGKPSREGYYNPDRESQSNEHWFPWLQHELIIRDILTQTPEMPRPYEPVYEDWRNMLERFDLDSETLLVGHSTGAGLLVRWLSEHSDATVNKVILVAPSLGLDWEDTKGFYDFEIDPDIVNRTAGITILVARNDKPGIIEAVQKIKSNCAGITVRELETGGHLTFGGLGKREFPELLDEVLA